MTREETTISGEELGEIFGSFTAVREEPIKALKTEAEPACEKRPKVVHDKFAQFEKPAAEPAVKAPAPAEEKFETDVDELVKRAEALEKEAKINDVVTGAKGVEPVKVAEFFEEIRKAIVSELEPKIDRKALENMMLRTLEKTAACHAMLKNTNWDPEGNLRLNGTIDMARFIKNVQACADKNGPDAVMAEAFTALLYSRLNSIKQGLGPDVYSVLKEKLHKKTEAIGAGYGAGTTHYFRNNILAPAISKGDVLK